MTNPDRWWHDPIGHWASEDAEADFKEEHIVKANQRNISRKIRTELMKDYSEPDRQRYFREYTKEYRKFKKKAIGEAKALLNYHGYRVEEK